MPQGLIKPLTTSKRYVLQSVTDVPSQRIILTLESCYVYLNVLVMKIIQNMYINNRLCQIILIAVLGFSIVVGLFAVKSSVDLRSEAASYHQLSISGNAYISGYVYVDENKNGERDLNEVGYSKATIQIYPHNKKTEQPRITDAADTMPMLRNDVLSQQTDQYGYFKMKNNLLIGDFDIGITIPSGYKSTTSTVIRKKELQRVDHQIIEFGLYPNNLMPYLPPSCTPRPSCLDQNPPCDMPIPVGMSWCNITPPIGVSISPEAATPTVIFPIQVRTYIPTDDGYVNEATPDRVYNNSSTLSINGRNNPNREAYIKFSVNSVTQPIQKALLRVFITNNSSTDGPALYSTENIWTETTLSFINKPQIISPLIEDKGVTSGNAWLEYDVTQIVSKNINNSYSFALLPTSSDGITISSKEGIHKPELVINF